MKIEALSKLRSSILEEKDYWDSVIDKACSQNAWFQKENITTSLNAIVSEFLDENKLQEWIDNYEIGPDQNKKIGIIMAGNLPLVGFADWLAVFMSGNISLVKCSDKDNVLFPAMMEKLNEINPELAFKTILVERLKDYDAVIATGSNNSSIYFESYFKHVPHIIRKNRTSVAVVNPGDGDDVIKKINYDISAYFGLGCRNVSKMYLPKGYDVKILMSNWEEMSDNILFNKYKNNFDYNLSLYMLNKIPFYTNNETILVEDASLFSRISCIHYEFYEDETQLIDKLQTNKEDIQCVVSSKPLGSIKVIPPGETQQPGLMDYADDVDTMLFIKSI